MAIYIKSFELASIADEIDFITNQRRTCYNGIYPFKIFPEKGFERIDFSPVTIFYGGNGSGKSTILNLIAESAGISRHSPFAGGAFFEKYLEKIIPCIFLRNIHYFLHKNEYLY